MNNTVKNLGYVPEAILINVPKGYFEHGLKEHNSTRNDANKCSRESWIAGREAAFRRYYESMGTAALSEEDCFYHFIAGVPVLPTIQHVYICFNGFVQYKAILVQFLKNQPVMLPHYQHPEPRDWCITTGPVIKAPEPIAQKGFQGFRYTKELF